MRSISMGCVSCIGSSFISGVLTTAKATAVNACNPTTATTAVNLSLLDGVSKFVELIKL